MVKDEILFEKMIKDEIIQYWCKQVVASHQMQCNAMQYSSVPQNLPEFRSSVIQVLVLRTHHQPTTLINPPSVS